jgi:hypothetical protein
MGCDKGTPKGVPRSCGPEFVPLHPSEPDSKEPPLKRKEIVAKEQNGTASALERCRPLAEQIRAEVREKEPEGLDTLALAEFLVALQGAAAVVLDGSTVTAAPSPNPPPHPDEQRSPADS